MVAPHVVAGVPTCEATIGTPVRRRHRRTPADALTGRLEIAPGDRVKYRVQGLVGWTEVERL